MDSHSERNHYDDDDSSDGEYEEDAQIDGVSGDISALQVFYLNEKLNIFI